MLYRPTRFASGISKLIKTETLKGNRGTTHDTGLLSGGMEAWKLKSLLLQLLLSIGEQGHIVPNNAQWFQKKTALSKRLFIANITDVIISASSTALQFAVMLRAKETSKQHLDCLDYAHGTGDTLSPHSFTNSEKNFVPQDEDRTNSHTEH